MGQKTEQKERSILYVHPEGEALAHGMGVWQPGQQIPVSVLKELPSEVLLNWKRNSLIIKEDLFKMYFPKQWNARHGRTEKVAVGVDPDKIVCGDEYTESMGPEDTRTV